jgi:hypothetical protein
LVAPGTQVTAATSNRDVVGSVITSAVSPGKAFELAQSAAQAANVVITDGAPQY